MKATRWMAAVLGGIATALVAAEHEKDPDWWGETGAVDYGPGAVENDLGVASLAQLKNIAAHAHARFESEFASMGGAGFDLDDVFPPLPPAGHPDRAAYQQANLAVASLGQVKAAPSPSTTGCSSSATARRRASAIS